MNKEVQIGQIEAGRAGDELIASGIGSCLAITFYDPKHKIGALAHTMLPARRTFFETRNSEHERRKSAERSGASPKGTSPGSPDTRYADTAIDEMLKRVQALGAQRENIEAKIIGGANMFSAYKSDIAEDNISYARGKLKNLGIPVAGECIGGSQGRSVEFSVASGIVTVKTKF